MAVGAAVNKAAEISLALADLNEEQTLKLVEVALASGVSGRDILLACQGGMNEVGARFERQDYFVSDLIMSGEIFKEVSTVLEPHLKAGAPESLGKIVLGTVRGDIHDIGKDIVANMLRSAGFEVIDLGVDVAPEKFVEAIQQSAARVVGMSGLLTLAFESMRNTINQIKLAGLREQVKVMIGGGSVDVNVCKSVGADDWGGDAQTAVRLSKRWYNA